MTTDLPEAHWLTRYDPDDGQPYGDICRCRIGDDHDAAGNVMQVVPADGERVQPEATTADTATIRPDGNGHLVRIDGRDVKFEVIWDGEDELRNVVVWTHDMDAVEVVLRARAYLEGPFAEACGDPRGEWGVDPEATWPGVDDDPGKYVRRVWARWRPLTTEERKEKGNYGYEGDEEVRWVESAVPGDGLTAASVVDLADG